MTRAIRCNFPAFHHTENSEFAFNNTPAILRQPAQIGPLQRNVLGKLVRTRITFVPRCGREWSSQDGGACTKYLRHLSSIHVHNEIYNHFFCTIPQVHGVRKVGEFFD